MCPLSAKLSHDVWALMDRLRQNVNVPRSLLRNGKRDRSIATFKASQVATVDEHLWVSSMPRHIKPSIPPSQSCQQSSQVPSQLLVSRETFATSTVMRELNLLKNKHVILSQHYPLSVALRALTQSCKMKLPTYV